MDLSTILGMLICFTVVTFAITIGGPLAGFIDPTSILVVICGSIAAVATCYPMSTLKFFPKIFSNALTFTPRDTKGLLEMLQTMSNRARREGTLSLEEFVTSIDDDFFSRGVQLVVDGHEPQAVEDILYLEISKIEERHELGIGMFDDLALLAPAFGMIGTLIGLVHMLGQLDDPTKIGPSMAVALLTTLYGSLISNIFALPVAKKTSISIERRASGKGNDCSGHTFDFKS